MSNNAPGPHLFVEHEASGRMTRAFGHYSNYHVYCERLRMVMVKNIDTVAPIFKKYFVNALRDTNESSENGHFTIVLSQYNETNNVFLRH